MQTAITVLSIITLCAFVAWRLCKLYLRATELQSIWLKRIDDLRVSDWAIVHRRLTEAEYDHLTNTLVTYKHGPTTDLAPTLRDVIVQFHVDPQG